MVAKTVLCEVCGNELDAVLKSCPYCNQKREPDYTQEIEDYFRVVNLERGMPLVHEALNRIDYELVSARQSGLKVLVLIHGYGSTGKGGAIKDSVRAELKVRQGANALTDILPGEDCGKHSPHARQILKRFPELNDYVRRPNPGITIVVL